MRLRAGNLDFNAFDGDSAVKDLMTYVFVVRERDSGLIKTSCSSGAVSDSLDCNSTSASKTLEFVTIE